MPSSLTSFQRKLNVPVTVTLLRSGLVNIAQQDQQLAKFLYTDPRPSLLNFATGLVRECLSSYPPIASQSQFQYTLEILTQLAQAGKANDEYVLIPLYLTTWLTVRKGSQVADRSSRRPSSCSTFVDRFYCNCGSGPHKSGNGSTQGEITYVVPAMGPCVPTLALS